MNPDFSELSDAQILQKLDDGAMAQEFENSEKWRLFREATKRLAAKAKHDLLTVDPLKNPTEVIELQIIAKFCDNVFQAIVTGFKNEGKLAFSEAKVRQLKIGPLTLSISK